MSNDQQNILIDFLDNNIGNLQFLEVGESILKNKETAQQWECLKLAVKGIEYAGLRERVALVGKEWQSQNQVFEKSKPAIVRNLYRNAIRVAASIFLLVGSAAVYKYTTVTSEGFLNKSYTSYDLNTSRGAVNADKLERAYRDKNWAEVLSVFNSLDSKNNKSYFLAGMANMELKKYGPAITNFEQIINTNTRSGDNYFGDEAQYYLALSLIANHEESKAGIIINQIKANKDHLYYNQANEISNLDLKIIQIKDRK